MQYLHLVSREFLALWWGLLSASRIFHRFLVNNCVSSDTISAEQMDKSTTCRFCTLHLSFSRLCTFNSSCWRFCTLHWSFLQFCTFQKHFLGRSQFPRSLLVKLFVKKTTFHGYAICPTFGNYSLACTLPLRSACNSATAESLPRPMQQWAMG